MPLPSGDGRRPTAGPTLAAVAARAGRRSRRGSPPGAAPALRAIRVGGIVAAMTEPPGRRPCPPRLQRDQAGPPQAAAPDRGAGPRHRTHGRAGPVLHRRPHPGVRGDQGAAGVSRSGCSTSTCRTAWWTPAAGGDEARRPSCARPPTPSPGWCAREPVRASHEHQHVRRHRHDLRALRAAVRASCPRCPASRRCDVDLVAGGTSSVTVIGTTRAGAPPTSRPRSTRPATYRLAAG